MSRNLVFGLLISFLAWNAEAGEFNLIDPAKIASLGFAAPIVADSSTLPTDTPFGSIVYDHSAGIFQGLTNTGVWVALSDPINANSVVSGGTERIERASLTIDAGGCSVASQSSSWLTSATRNGTGDCTISIAASQFTATPTCIATAYTDNTAATTQYSIAIASVSTSAVRFHINYQQDGGSGAVTERDAPFYVICMGPR